MDFNPWLKKPHPNKGGGDYLETYAPPTLVPWQTRSASPSDYEQTLADELQQIFADKVYDLPGIIARLNESSVRLPTNNDWTKASFQAEMKRLGEWQ